MAFIHSVQMSPLRPKPTRPFEEHEYSSDNETGLHVTNTTHSRRQPEWRMSSSRPRAALPVARALDEHEYSSDVDSSSQVNNKNPSLRELRMSSSRPRVPVALDDSEHEYSSDVETSSQVNEHEYTSTGTVMQVRSLNRNQISSQRQRSSVTRGEARSMWRRSDTRRPVEWDAEEKGMGSLPPLASHDNSFVPGQEAAALDCKSDGSGVSTSSMCALLLEVLDSESIAVETVTVPSIQGTASITLPTTALLIPGRADSEDNLNLQGTKRSCRITKSDAEVDVAEKNREEKDRRKEKEKERRGAVKKRKHVEWREEMEGKV